MLSTTHNNKTKRPFAEKSSIEILLNLVAVAFVCFVISVDIYYLVENKDIIRDELNPIMKMVIMHGSVGCAAALRFLTASLALVSLNFLWKESKKTYYVFLTLFVLQHIGLLCILII